MRELISLEESVLGLYVRGNNVRVIKNPNSQQFEAVRKASSLKEVRGIIDTEGNNYIWDAGKAIHADAQNQLGVTIEVAYIIKPVGPKTFGVEQYDVSEKDIEVTDFDSFNRMVRGIKVVTEGAQPLEEGGISTAAVDKEARAALREKLPEEVNKIIANAEGIPEPKEDENGFKDYSAVYDSIYDHFHENPDAMIAPLCEALSRILRTVVRDHVEKVMQGMIFLTPTHRRSILSRLNVFVETREDSDDEDKKYNGYWNSGRITVKLFLNRSEIMNAGFGLVREEIFGEDWDGAIDELFKAVIPTFAHEYAHFEQWLRGHDTNSVGDQNIGHITAGVEKRSGRGKRGSYTVGRDEASYLRYKSFNIEIDSFASSAAAELMHEIQTRHRSWGGSDINTSIDGLLDYLRYGNSYGASKHYDHYFDLYRRAIEGRYAHIGLKPEQMTKVWKRFVKRVYERLQDYSGKRPGKMGSYTAHRASEQHLNIAKRLPFAQAVQEIAKINAVRIIRGGNAPFTDEALQYEVSHGYGEGQDQSEEFLRGYYFGDDAWDNPQWDKVKELYRKMLLAYARKEFQTRGDELMKRPWRVAAESVNESVLMDNPNFKAWFRNSKVVDQNGEPLEVYHGGPQGIKIFGANIADTIEWAKRNGYKPSELERRTWANPVHFFTDDESVAYGYSDQGDNPHVYNVYLRIEKPLDLRPKVVGLEQALKNAVIITGEYQEVPASHRDGHVERFLSQIVRMHHADMKERCHAHGYDGIIMPDTDVRDRSMHTAYVVFEPNQIKKVDARAFDNENHDIHESVLMEVAGTYGFFHPETEQEILTPGHMDHADYVAKHPEQFGLTAEDMPVHTGERYMARIIDLVIARGWVRVNFFKGAWFFQAKDLKTVHGAVAHYYMNDLVEEAVIDYGPDSTQPGSSVTLYPSKKVAYFVKTGKIPEE